MESIIITASIMGGGLIIGFSGLVGFAKYLTNKLNIENEEKMNNACNKMADRIEANMKKLSVDSMEKIE